MHKIRSWGEFNKILIPNFQSKADLFVKLRHIPKIITLYHPSLKNGDISEIFESSY